MDNVHLCVCAALAASLLGCTGDPAGSAVVQDQNAYLAELAEWKAGRVATLKGPTGFLNLIGLFWLRHDVSTFGSSPDSNFVLPGHAAPTVGSFHREDGQLVMTVENGVEVFHHQTPIRAIVMDDDQSDQPVVLTHGSLAWTVIRRDEKLAVRVRDFDNPAIEAFKPIKYFPVDRSFRVAAILQRFNEPR